MNFCWPPSLLGRQHAVRSLLVVSATFLLLATARADELASTDFLADLSLEELLGTEITTLSRKSESLGNAPAAVYVISQSDIRRSGARTIPDLLRMVPGMQVAQIDGNKWAVTSRGANGRFANKLLVLMDGRTLYSPLLAGVYWDVQDTDLGAIERIEVIRGPGATMWGSNAVNGVVNIITKHAADSQGGSLSVVGGQGGAESVIRYGAETDKLAYRIYGKAFDRDGNINLAGDATGDDSSMARIGGRIDWTGKSGGEWMVSGEAYSGESGDHRYTRSLAPPYLIVEDTVSDVSGVFALAQWSKKLSSDSGLQVRSYISSYDREVATYSEKLKTFDIDIQHRIERSENVDLMWGLNYRNNQDETESTFEIQIDPADRTQNLLSAFVQGDFRLMDDRFRLVLGSKFENNTYSDKDIEIEPSIRLSTSLNEHSFLWASISQAVRMPSRGEQNGRVVSEILPPGQPGFPLPVPTVVSVVGNPDIKSEEVTAYEIGYRYRNDEFVFDLALFYNKFDDLRSLSIGVPTCEPGGGIPQIDPTCLATATHVVTPLLIENANSSETSGAELWISKSLTEWWRIQLAYTYFHAQALGQNSGAPSLSIIEDSPDGLASLRSSMDLPSDFSLDLWLRWNDELEAQQIDAYTTLDLRLAWSPTPRMSVAAVGRNLFAEDHLEFMSELVDLAAVQIEAEGYIEFRWNF
ncbi:MAG: TonB-dependent receptor plug domain-containing protein [Woeseiaceae bacterium]